MPSTEVLHEFKSHIEGKNAIVRVYEDRIEWEQTGLLTFSRKRNTTVIPMKSITSVITHKAGVMSFTVVKVVTAGGSLEMRVTKDEAHSIKDLVLSKIL